MTPVSETLRLAMQEQRAGKLRQAAARYRQILEVDPHHIDALHLLGLTSTQLGRHEEARDYLLQAVRLKPEFAEARNSLGTVWMKERKLTEAAECYRQALRLSPELAHVHNNLGLAVAAQGKLVEAESCYREALRLHPGYFRARHNLGISLFDQGKLDEARICFEQVIDACPDSSESQKHLASILTRQGKLVEAASAWRGLLSRNAGEPEVHNNLGIVLKKQGKLNDAIGCYRRALALKHDYPQALNNLGIALLEQGRLDEAETLLRTAILHQPSYAEAYIHLGAVLVKRENVHEAVACCQEAIRLQPDDEAAHYNLGIALRRQGDLHAAIECYRQALRLTPDHAKAHCNLGCIFLDLWRVDEALACFLEALRLEPSDSGTYADLALLYSKQGDLETAVDYSERGLRLRPDCALLHHNLGHVLLQMGHWQAGWTEYEWRWKYWEQEGRPAPVFEQPRWDGSPLEGRTILLYAEQGFGDTLQFIRYASLVAERGGRVVVACPAPLIEVLIGCPGIDRLIPMDGPFPAIDVQAPLMSLPHIFQTTPDTVPASIPYLFADAVRVESWRQTLGQLRDAPGEASFEIGIAWQGNPKFRSDRDRSFGLKEFAPLAELSGVRLVSLQFGAGTEQLPPLLDTWPLIDLGDLDFRDTASVMRNLDLVVSVDSAPAHLAGALGVPVWVALPFASDFRWFLDREDSPWYPTMRLFRQRKPGRWPDVFERMAAEVKIICSTDSSKVASLS